jgi:hypothetical protein
MPSRYGPEQAELQAFVECLSSICERPYRSQRDYADAVCGALKKGAIPAFLLELCIRVRDMSRDQAVTMQDADLPPMSQAFIDVVSELLKPAPRYSVESADRYAATGEECDLQAHSCSRYTPYAEPMYRGFIDGV